MTKFKTGLLIGAIGACILLKHDSVKSVLKKMQK